ncbi:MAG: hypothetical protein IKQ17_02300 [Kiritimatiellae bacterium]|nr:hypothetical protein [Kiritimatiellia bacterium]
MDDSATLEASFLQQPLHDDIIGMGVDAKVTAPGKCPFDAGTPNTLCAAVARKSMNHTVWAVIQPIAAMNLAVCWFNVWADAENERSDYFSAAAVVVGLVRDISSRENLESEQKGNAHGGKKPSCPLALSPKLSKARHLQLCL